MGPSEIERERSFTYAPAILGANGQDVITPVESREDPEIQRRMPGDKHDNGETFV